MVCDVNRHHLDGFLNSWKGGGDNMAKTKSSVHGKQEKKIVTVNGYKKSDGTRVKPHRHSTPN